MLGLVAQGIDMGTRMFGGVHKTGGTRSGLVHATLVMAVQRIDIAGRVRGEGRRSEVARLLKVVHMRVRRYHHACLPESENQSHLVLEALYTITARDQDADKPALHG